MTKKELAKLCMRLEVEYENLTEERMRYVNKTKKGVYTRRMKINRELHKCALDLLNNYGAKR